MTHLSSTDRFLLFFPRVGPDKIGERYSRFRLRYYGMFNLNEKNKLSGTSAVSSPVDRSDVSSHETGLLAGQEHDGIGNFLHLPMTTEGVCGFGLFQELGILFVTHATSLQDRSDTFYITQQDARWAFSRCILRHKNFRLQSGFDGLMIFLPVHKKWWGGK